MMFLSAGRGRSTQAPTGPRCIRSSGDLDHERTCRENLALRSTSEGVGSIVRPGQLATVDDALGEMLSPLAPSFFTHQPQFSRSHTGSFAGAGQALLGARP